MNEIVPIRMSTQDKKKLQERADANRLKLSTYLRHQLTKNLEKTSNLWQDYIVNQIFLISVWMLLEQNNY